MNRVLLLSVVFALAVCPLPAFAGIPFPPYCTCTLSVSQIPPRPQCLALTPAVLRLCPDAAAAPAFDALSITVRVRGAVNTPIPSAFVTFSERSGTVNIATGGSTTALTTAQGLATVSLTRASGSGRVALCADGIELCSVQVRSPDVSSTAIPSGCTLPVAGTSFVNGAEILNPACGYLSQFGPVTTGVNDAWDLNCDGFVNPIDVIGALGKGGLLQHFGHGGVLGNKNICTP